MSVCSLLSYLNSLYVCLALDNQHQPAADSRCMATDKAAAAVPVTPVALTAAQLSRQEENRTNPTLRPFLDHSIRRRRQLGCTFVVVVWFVLSRVCVWLCVRGIIGWPVHGNKIARGSTICRQLSVRCL